MGFIFFHISELTQLSDSSEYCDQNDAVVGSERGEVWAGMGPSSFGSSDCLHELKSPRASSLKVGGIHFLR